MMHIGLVLLYQQSGDLLLSEFRRWLAWLRSRGPEEAVLSV